MKLMTHPKHQRIELVIKMPNHKPGEGRKQTQKIRKKEGMAWSMENRKLGEQLGIQKKNLSQDSEGQGFVAWVVGIVAT